MSWRIASALLGVVLLAGPAVGDVINADCYDDGDGAVTMGAWTWSWDDVEGTAYMNVPEVQHWGPAHIYPEFYTDTPADPYAWIIKEVENDTTFDWTDYHVNITMDHEFSIVTATSPTDWLTPSITQPTQQDDVWVGSIDYQYDGVGTEITIGNIGEFGMKLSFSGTSCFCVEQIPTPEPSSLGLLSLAAFGLLRRR